MGFFFKMNLKSVLKENDIYPLFGGLLKGQPYIFDFSSKNPSNRYKTGRSVSNTTPKKAMENEFKELKPSKKKICI